MGCFGQLGNQMTQFAVLLAIAKKNGYDFGIPYATRSPLAKKHLALPDGFINLTAKDCSNVNQRYEFEEHEANYWEYDPRVMEVKDQTNLLGYFQVERYILNVRDQLLLEFRSRGGVKQKVGNYLAGIRKLNKPIVFLHVRRGDALTNKLMVFPGKEYFKQAILQFPDSMFIVLTDDRRWCEDNLPPMQNWLFSPFLDKFEDLELMQQTDAGIIHNSTFSWWGAWLGDLNRKIVAPKRWNAKGKCEIYHNSWILL